MFSDVAGSISKSFDKQRKWPNQENVLSTTQRTTCSTAGQIRRLSSARRGSITTAQQFHLRGDLIASIVGTNSLISDTRYSYNADDQISET